MPCMRICQGSSSFSNRLVTVDMNLIIQLFASGKVVSHIHRKWLSQWCSHPHSLDFDGRGVKMLFGQGLPSPNLEGGVEGGGGI